MSIFINVGIENRIIDISDEPASLRVNHGQLIIALTDREEKVPLEELAVLIVSHPAVHYTHAVLAGICSEGGSFIVCNEKRIPAGMLFPLEGHFAQTERFAIQASITLPTKKQIWMQIIKSKVLAQGKLLRQLRESDFGLANLAKKVRSGDPSNIEAQASRRYWPALFGDAFRRIPGSDDGVNRLLNYGYAVLRAVVTRAVCAAGLHPSLGIHHHSRYNPFCLADDLMEPLRPIVDAAVISTVDMLGPDAPLEKASKSTLLNELASRRLKLAGESLSVFDATRKYASSLASIYMGKRRKLVIPEL
jgi:CRISPR-associated protein Cas1